MRNLTIALCTALLLSVVACGDDDSGGSPDAIVIFDSNPADAPRPDATTGDGNDDFAQAKDLDVAGSEGYEAVIEKARDRDYYKMDLAAGDWIAVGVDSSAAETFWNPAIKMFKADTTTVVTLENDAHPTFWNNDPEIVFRAPEAGTYYFVVGDVYDLANAGTPHGGLTYNYLIYGIKMSTQAGFNIATTDSGDTTAEATDLTVISNSTTGSKTAFVMADYKATSDVDVYKFNVPAFTGTDKPFLQVVAPTSAHAQGLNNYGSTICPGKISVAAVSAPTTILAQVNACSFMQNGQTDFDNNWLLMPVEPGDYFIFAERPSTGGGANDFYTLTVATGKDNQREAETAGGNSNDIAANAETMTLKASSGVSFGWFSSRLSATDIDWFKATAPSANNGFFAACWALSNGSGLTGFQVQVFSDAGTTSAGTLSEPAAITPIYGEFGATPGTAYHFKMSATGQSDTVTGNFATCLVFFYTE